jgi:atypical dual specificity phosphatase
MQTMQALGVRAVINLCDEFKGPTRTYQHNGVSLLWLRTVDHLEPTVEAMRTACSFIEHHRLKGSSVHILPG